jgi:hypothetical protein
MTPIGEAIDYDSLQAVMRLRADQLKISRAEIDRLSGLPDGFASKVLCEQPIRRLGPDTIGPMMAALAMKMVLAQDAQAFAKYAARCQQREEKQARNATYANTVSMAELKLVNHAFFKRNGKRAARARNAKLSGREKSQIARLGGLARWKKHRVKRRMKADRFRAKNPVSPPCRDTKAIG